MAASHAALARLVIRSPILPNGQHCIWPRSWGSHLPRGISAGFRHTGSNNFRIVIERHFCDIFGTNKRLFASLQLEVQFFALASIFR